MHAYRKTKMIEVQLHRFLTLEQSASRSSHFILRGKPPPTHPVLTGVKVVWAPEPFWKFCNRELSFAPAGFRIAYIPACSLVTISAQRRERVRDWIKKVSSSLSSELTLLIVSSCVFLFYHQCYYFNILCKKKFVPLSDFPHLSRLPLEPTQPPTQWVPILSWGVKRPGCGSDHPTPSSAEVKERVELYIYSPSGASWSVLRKTLPLPSLRGCNFPLMVTLRLFRETNSYY